MISSTLNGSIMVPDLIVIGLTFSLKLTWQFCLDNCLFIEMMKWQDEIFDR